MRIIGRILKWLALAIVLLVIGSAGWLYLFPPALIRVGTAFAAKMVCSSYFVGHRDPVAVLAEDVQAPGHPLLKYIRIEKPFEDTFSASLFGFWARSYAVNRPGLGCAVAPDGDVEALRKISLAASVNPTAASDFEWPLGDEVSLDADPAVSALVADPALAGPGMRGIVVVKDGRIVAEAYGAGFNADSPLMGWSMTKTVTGALVAARVAERKLAWDKNHLFADWTDERSAIRVSDLMSMQSGLDLEERYGDVNDVTRMLFLEKDQAGFVEGKGLEATPGSTFRYTTGSAVLLTRLWMDTFADPQEALAYPRKALFGPIGMQSAVMETDATGTFSGGSLMYATARDWARFGLLLADRGDWNGVQVLPSSFTDMVSAGTALSGNHYTQGLAWKSGPNDEDKAISTELPADAFWALGHDGQSMVVIPSEKLVIVRLGLTPSSLKYRPQVLAGKIVKALKAKVD